MLFLLQDIAYTETVEDDEHLYIIDRAGARAAAILDDPDRYEAFQSIHVEAGMAQVFKRMRYGMSDVRPSTYILFKF